MKFSPSGLLSLLAMVTSVQATEFHIAPTGSDANPGTRSAPFRSIQRGAEAAQPGDVITVHAGVYRERINPPRGGVSDQKRIVFRAAPGERVAIKGSEIITNWVRLQPDLWQATIPNAFFGSFNPYSDLIHGDWFTAKGRAHHTGAVYLNGDWLTEAATRDEVLKPAGSNALWFATVDATNTTIWAQFPGMDPNAQLVEINVRRTVFYPEKTGINYLTVRGFTLTQAATSWAPPTAEQFGVIGTHWSKVWIIESNLISYSTCCGIALGKYGDEWDNRAESAEGYVGTLTRALTNGWNRATVGSHLVRDNEVSHCEQTGIVGSLGCAFSTITGNSIHDIHVRQLFSGAEMAGIKFHGAIDVVISRNHIYRCGDVSGIWLDWMAQGAQVTGNLLHDNFGNGGDIFFEMQHGPILVANNLLLSKRSLQLNSQGIAFVHNLIAGSIRNLRNDRRSTPFHPAHSTEVAGLYPAARGDSGDYRFFNNLLLAPCKLSALDSSVLPYFCAGNVFTAGTQPSKFDTNALLKPEFDSSVKLTETPDGWYLQIIEDKAWSIEASRKLTTTKLLGKAVVSNQPFENADGSALRLNTDYFGKLRNKSNPFPGPFEISGNEKESFKVWPLTPALPAW